MVVYIGYAGLEDIFSIKTRQLYTVTCAGSVNINIHTSHIAAGNIPDWREYQSGGEKN